MVPSPPHCRHLSSCFDESRLWSQPTTCQADMKGETRGSHSSARSRRRSNQSLAMGAESTLDVACGLAPVSPPPAVAPRFPLEATCLLQGLNTAPQQWLWANQWVICFAQSIQGSPRPGQTRGNRRSLELLGIGRPVPGGCQAGTTKARSCWAIFTPHQKNQPDPKLTQKGKPAGEERDVSNSIFQAAAANQPIP